MMFMGVLLLGCGTSIEPATPDEAVKIEAANKVRIEANDHARSRNYWAALASFEKAEELYNQTNHPSSYWSQYLLHRTKAKMTDNVDASGIAANRMDTALDWLTKAKESGVKLDNYNEEIDYEAEEISSLSYKATYLSHDQQFVAANIIMEDLLELKEIKKNFHGQIKNRMGKNLMELFAYGKAHKAFDEILKPSGLPKNLRANYLLNRAKAAHMIALENNGDQNWMNQAFADIGESIAINESLGDKREVYAFNARMHLGDFYLSANQNEKAMENFDLAMLKSVNINQDPDLFKIHGMRWVAARSLDHDNFNSHKILFDSLSKIHTNRKERFSGQQQLDRLDAGLSVYNTRDMDKNENARNITMWLVFGSICITLFILFVLISKGVLSYRKGKTELIAK